MKSMNAIVLHGQKDLRREIVPTPQVGAADVRIRVTRAGICGSDLHYYRHGKCGSFVPSIPFILGHEFTGEVVEAGDQVKGVPVASRVAVDPSQPCRTCAACQSGRYNLCAHMKYLGTASVVPPRDGAFAEYITVPAANCHVLPAGFDEGVAALLEPLSVAAHALLRAGCVSGKSILVTGGGTIGQMIVVMARAFGAKSVCLSDPRLYSREMALKSGADCLIDPTAPNQESVTLAEFDVVFEASGSVQALRMGLDKAKRGGTIVQVGTLPDEVNLPLNKIMTKELQVLGSFRFANVFGLIIDLVKGGRLQVQHLISRVVPFDQLPEAFSALERGEDLIKVQVEGPNRAADAYAK